MGQHILHITTSIGMSLYPDDGPNAETLIKNADTAMYQAKENGRQSFQFFRQEMNVRAVERQSIEEDLRRALERKEFTLHYQPKINLATGAITGAEALLRWTHPDSRIGSSRAVHSRRGRIRPDLADRRLGPAGGVHASPGMDRRRFAFRDHGRKCFRNRASQRGLSGGLFSTLSETGLDPRVLELEVTESVLMKNAEAATSILRSAAGKGSAGGGR